ncbi:epiphycan [Menidia menidia]
MRMIVQLVFGLFVLKAAVASPRFSRQVDSDTYDTANYDYEDQMMVYNSREEMPPPDYNYEVAEDSLEEEKEVEEEEEEGEQGELHLKSQLVPQGSGGSGALMGPETQKEVELHLPPNDILHVPGDFEGSTVSGASGASGSGGSGAESSASGDIILISSPSKEFFSSEGSAEFLSSGDLLISGDFSGSGDTMGSAISGASGDFASGGSGIAIELPIGSGESGEQSGSGFSGDPLFSGVSGSSGVSGDSDESGIGITLLSGEDELPLFPDIIPQETSGASGEFSGASGGSGASGDFASGDIEVSGTSGASGVSGSGDIEVPEITLVPKPDEEEELLPITPETPQEGASSVEETVSSGLPEPEQPEEPDEPVVDRRGMPTCLLCTCLGGSVYCDDLKLDSVPPLPKDTTHFYARYNRITKINKSDFAFMNKLKKIDLTANEITSIEDRTFMGLPELEELVIRENHISQLPALPETMTLIDASHNNIGSKGILKEAFKDMTGLQYLYLTDNTVDYIPVPLPDSLRSLHLQRNNIQMMHEDTFCNLNDFNYIRNALEDIRLDGNPINLSRTPQAYVCLPRIPIGDLI